MCKCCLLQIVSIILLHMKTKQTIITTVYIVHIHMHNYNNDHHCMLQLYNSILCALIEYQLQTNMQQNFTRLDMILTSPN